MQTIQSLKDWKRLCNLCMRRAFILFVCLTFRLAWCQTRNHQKERAKSFVFKFRLLVKLSYINSQFR